MLPKEVIAGRGLQCQHQTHIGAKETLVIGPLLGVPCKECDKEVVSNINAHTASLLSVHIEGAAKSIAGQ